MGRHLPYPSETCSCACACPFAAMGTGWHALNVRCYSAGSLVRNTDVPLRISRGFLSIICSLYWFSSVSGALHQLVTVCIILRNVFEPAATLRLRAATLRCCQCWRRVTIALHRLREGCDALCWERQRCMARRMLRAWGAWAGGQALLDGRAGVTAAAADVEQQMKAARAEGGVAALAEAEAIAKTRPVVHCFLTSLGQPRIVATHHHPPAVSLAGRHMWTAVVAETGSELSIEYPASSAELLFKRQLPRAMRIGVLALPVRCWREWAVVRRGAVRDRSIAKAHGDVIRVYCALRAWALQHQCTARAGAAAEQQQRSAGSLPQHEAVSTRIRQRGRAETAAERVWYIFWRNRMRCELQLQLVTRHEWNSFWTHIPRDVQI